MRRHLLVVLMALLALRTSEASDALDRYPTRGGWDRWARTATGHVAMPPARVMKSRRLMPPLSRVAHHTGWGGSRYR